LKSPIAYGYDGKDLPVYFNQDPVLNVSPVGVAGGFGGGGRGAGGAGAGGPINAGAGQNITPNAVPIQISPLEPGGLAETPAAIGGGRGGRRGGRGRGGADGAAGGARAANDGGEEPRPRVVVRFPADPNEMLLSGTLAGGEVV